MLVTQGVCSIPKRTCASYNKFQCVTLHDTVFHDHNYDDRPQTTKRKLNVARMKLDETRKANRTLKQTVRRLKTKHFRTLMCLEHGTTVLMLNRVLIDEMTIKKGCQRGRDGVMRGHVDLGVGTSNGDDLLEATSAIVIMVVMLDTHGKLPIGYILINSLNAEAKANLLRESFIRLQKANVTVCSLTLDGPTDHFAALEELGNRLHFRHIQFRKMIMKVFLAAQTLSSSVADSLEFCCDILQLPEFQGCKATARFLRCVDTIFDFLNVRNPWGKHTKSPLRRDNENVWRPKLVAEIAHLAKLTEENGKPIFRSRRKAEFVGFFTAVISIFNIFDSHVKPLTSQMKYLLTYKTSQDHLELFFCAIRARGGWCPNPTENKKKRARLDRYNLNVYDEVHTTTVAEKYGLNSITDNSSFAEMSEFLNFSWGQSPYINEFSQQAIGYISAAITRGCLVIPSSSVVQICLTTESLFRRACNMNSGKPPVVASFPAILATRVFQQVVENHRLFPELENHNVQMFSAEDFISHTHRLIKIIISSYIELRIRKYHARHEDDLGLGEAESESQASTGRGVK
ncbi:uncharacterized protein LOC143219578 [Lasioglossum baleicum]|uniref:uncharacterized protein LOC143219578 n=1 Tax=Lasioglossum baleicum TaxID=434251 RepID=UPI003FCCAE45